MVLCDSSRKANKDRPLGAPKAAGFFLQSHSVNQSMSQSNPNSSCRPCLGGAGWGRAQSFCQGCAHKGGRTYCEVDRKWTIWILSLACKSKHHQSFLCALWTVLASLEARQGILLQNFVTSEEETEAQDRGSYLRPAGLPGGEKGDGFLGLFHLGSRLLLNPPQQNLRVCLSHFSAL